MKDDIETLEAMLEFYQVRLKHHQTKQEKDRYETQYLETYHELQMMDPRRSQRFIEWYVRHAKL